MAFRFTHHYTRDEARALLPQVRGWITGLRQIQARADSCAQRLRHVMQSGGDAGGATVNEQVETLAEFGRVRRELEEREIQIKELERGLVDFPSLVAGREVFLCWQEGEEDVSYWHEIEDGFAGREPL
jgi:hypothetical protein